MKPEILMPEQGFHARKLIKERDDLLKKHSYKDVSTVMFVPTLGMIHFKAVNSWLSMMTPMNQKFARIFLSGMEVGQAYEQMIDIIRGNPELQKWKYVLTVEDDNVAPPDGLLKLYEDIESGPYDAVGGLYWTKGEAGKPMCYGKVDSMPKDFIPWLPPPDTVVPCNGLGMGFTLFRMKMFLDERFERPLFKTQQQHTPGVGTSMYTQDLRFAENAGKLGYKFGCSSRCLVGHVSREDSVVW